MEHGTINRWRKKRICSHKNTSAAVLLVDAHEGSSRSAPPFARHQRFESLQRVSPPCTVFTHPLRPLHSTPVQCNIPFYCTLRLLFIQERERASRAHRLPLPSITRLCQSGSSDKKYTRENRATLRRSSVQLYKHFTVQYSSAVDQWQKNGQQYSNYILI